MGKQGEIFMKITKSTLERLIREELKEVALGTQDIPSAIADRESAQSSLDDTKSRLKHERTRVVELTKEMSQLDPLSDEWGQLFKELQAIAGS